VENRKLLSKIGFSLMRNATLCMRILVSEWVLMPVLFRESFKTSVLCEFDRGRFLTEGLPLLFWMRLSVSSDKFIGSWRPFRDLSL